MARLGGESSSWAWLFLFCQLRPAREHSPTLEQLIPGVSAAAEGLPETVGADALPTWQINGVVWSQAIVGRTVYVTGKFTKARPPGVARGGPGEVDAANVFAFDLNTGTMVTSFRHSLNGQGLIVRASPDGTRIYVGGDFTAVDGFPRLHLAAFDTATNGLVEDFSPRVAGQVRALAISQDTVYVGGNFQAAGGVTGIRSLASFAVAGGADHSWHPIVGGVSPVVYSMALVPAGDAMSLAGGSTSWLDHGHRNGQGRPGRNRSPVGNRARDADPEGEAGFFHLVFASAAAMETGRIPPDRPRRSGRLSTACRTSRVAGSA